MTLTLGQQQQYEASWFVSIQQKYINFTVHISAISSEYFQRGVRQIYLSWMCVISSLV